MTGGPVASGAFYEPTLLTDVAHGSTINATEIFGPVTAVVRFSTRTRPSTPRTTPSTG